MLVIRKSAVLYDCCVPELRQVVYVCSDAVRLNPKHFRALKLLGSAMYARGDLQAACTALESALQLTPAYADAHCDLGCVRCALGQVEEAKLCFADAVRHNPAHVEVSLLSYFDVQFFHSIFETQQQSAVSDNLIQLQFLLCYCVLCWLKHA